MDTDKLLRDISLDLDTFQAHIKRMRKHKQLHRLDIDLLQEKTRLLYDKLLSLDASSAQSDSPEDARTIVLPEKMPEAEIPETAKSREQNPDNKVAGDSPLSKPAEEKKEMATVKVAETPPSTEQGPVEDKKPQKPAQAEKVIRDKEPIVQQAPDKPKPVVEPKPEEPAQVENTLQKDQPAEREEPEKSGPPLNPEAATKQTAPEEVRSQSAIDLFSSSASETIGDKLGGSDAKSIADQMQKSAIADLKQAIGINEKFLFINELFNGDLGKYNKAIEEFNELQSMEGVRAHLVEMKVLLQWDEQSDAYKKLETLLERKFG